MGASQTEESVAPRQPPQPFICHNEPHMNPNLFRRFLRCTVGAAAIEAAIVFPLLLILVIGLVDLGTEMFIVMEVNNAAQAGAANAVQNQSVAGVASAMTNAAGGISISATPAPTFGTGPSLFLMKEI